MEERSQYVELGYEAERRHARNTRTRCAAVPELGPEISLEQTFNEIQRDLRRRVAEAPQPGMLIAVAHPRIGLVGSAWAEASDRPRSITVGRHSATDLFLPFDDGLSLRHVLVLVRAEGPDVLARVVELESEAGMRDEHGDGLSACEVNGFVALRLQDYVLFICPTGTPLPWDPHAENPWATLPERTYVHRMGSGVRRALPERKRQARETVVRAMEGPREPHGRKPVDRDELAGHLALSVRGEEVLLPVSRRELQRGALVGRYLRCHGANFVDDACVSRVHLLVLRIGEVLYAVDAGSTNGTYLDGRQIRCARLMPRAVVDLGSEETRVRWEPCPSGQGVHPANPAMPPACS